MSLVVGRDVVAFLVVALVAALVAIVACLALMKSLQTVELGSTELIPDRNSRKFEGKHICEGPDQIPSRIDDLYSLEAADGDGDGDGRLEDVDDLRESSAGIGMDQTLLQGLNTFPVHAYDEYRYAQEMDEDDFFADD